MAEYNQVPMSYIYIYSCHEDELSICRLEMRSLFGFDIQSTILESTLRIDPSLSPFIRERIDVMNKGICLENIAQQVEGLKISGSTYKVIYEKGIRLICQE